MSHDRVPLDFLDQERRIASLEKDFLVVIESTKALADQVMKLAALHKDLVELMIDKPFVHSPTSEFRPVSVTERDGA